MLTQLMDRLTNYVRDQWHAATYRAATEGGAAGLEDAIRDLTGGAVTVQVRIDGGTLRLTEDAVVPLPDLDTLDRPALMRLAKERGHSHQTVRRMTAAELQALLTT